MPDGICCDLSSFTPGKTGGAEAFLVGLLTALVEMDEVPVSVCGNETTRSWAERIAGLKTTATPEPKTVLWAPLNRSSLRRPADVLTVHDAIPKHYIDYAERYALPKRERVEWRARWETTKVSAKRAQRVVSVSHAAASQLESLLGRPVVGVPNGPSRFVATTPTASWHGSEGSVALCVTSGGRPHKGTDMISSVAMKFPGIHFKVLGRIPVTGLANIEPVGWVEPEDLVKLYQSSAFLFFPSEIEGFGMPVLEALHIGLPVVCSDIGPAREICGDLANFFDPLSIEQAADAVEADRVGDLTQSSRRASQFTWDLAAAEYVRIFEELL